VKSSLHSRLIRWKIKLTAEINLLGYPFYMIEYYNTTIVIPDSIDIKCSIPAGQLKTLVNGCDQICGLCHLEAWYSAIIKLIHISLSFNSN
jgi:hypothetical protein